MAPNALILEGAQAGLSWATILKKREGYQRTFDGFDPEKIARYTPAKRHKLLQDSGIVRNRLKIESAVGNANAYLARRAAGNTLSSILWGFVDGRPVQNQWRTQDQVPASTPQSDWVLPRSRRRDRAIPTSSWVHI